MMPRVSAAGGNGGDDGIGRYRLLVGGRVVARKVDARAGGEGERQRKRDAGQIGVLHLHGDGAAAGARDGRGKHFYPGVDDGGMQTKAGGVCHACRITLRAATQGNGERRIGNGVGDE